jgi:hypothetical protein
MTSATQRAVDRLDWIARGAQYDERNRVLVCQGGLHELRNLEKDAGFYHPSARCLYVLVLTVQHLGARSALDIDRRVTLGMMGTK